MLWGHRKRNDSFWLQTSVKASQKRENFEVAIKDTNYFYRKGDFF